MKNLVLNLGFALGLAMGAAACGGSSGGECDSLAKKICDGKGDAYCEKTKKWLDEEMVGPDGESMTGEQKNMACKLIGEDSDVISAYRKQAERDLGSN